MDTKKYRIAVYSTPITFPLTLAVHTWVITESPEHGVFRYDIFCFKNPATKNYFYVNKVPEKQGMSIFALLNYAHAPWKFNSTCLYTQEGEEVKDIVEKTQKAVEEYPYKHKYILLPGPNSNTFTAWIIEKAGLQHKVRLPWNAFGKNFLK